MKRITDRYSTFPTTTPHFRTALLVGLAYLGKPRARTGAQSRPTFVHGMPSFSELRDDWSTFSRAILSFKQCSHEHLKVHKSLVCHDSNSIKIEPCGYEPSLQRYLVTGAGKAGTAFTFCSITGETTEGRYRRFYRPALYFHSIPFFAPINVLPCFHQRCMPRADGQTDSQQLEEHERLHAQKSLSTNSL